MSFFKNMTSCIFPFFSIFPYFRVVKFIRQEKCVISHPCTHCPHSQAFISTCVYTLLHIPLECSHLVACQSYSSFSLHSHLWGDESLNLTSKSNQPSKQKLKIMLTGQTAFQIKEISQHRPAVLERIPPHKSPHHTVIYDTYYYVHKRYYRELVMGTLQNVQTRDLR